MADIQALIQQLDDQKQGAAAFKTLYDMSATIVEPLIAALNSPNVTIRSQVAGILGNSGDQRAVETLMKLTRDREVRVRGSAIAALGRFKADAQIADFLKNLARQKGDVNERMGAVFAFERLMGKPAAIPLWLEMLNDPSPQLIGNAASQLSQSKASEAVEPLIAILKREGEKSPAFLSLTMALGKIGDPRAFEALATYLKSNDPHKRACAASALGDLGDARAIALLEPYLKDKAIAFKEDHGPDIPVSDSVRTALEALRKKHGVTAKAEEVKEAKPRWKLW